MVRLAVLDMLLKMASRRGKREHALAIDTLKAVAKQLDQSLPPSRDLPLIGSAANPLQTPERLISQRSTLQKLLPDSPWQAAQLDHLESSHGLNAAELVNSWSAAEREPLSQVMPICNGELRHAIEKEKARSVTSFLQSVEAP